MHLPNYIYGLHIDTYHSVKQTQLARVPFCVQVGQGLRNIHMYLYVSRSCLSSTTDSLTTMLNDDGYLTT